MKVNETLAKLQIMPKQLTYKVGENEYKYNLRLNVDEKVVTDKDSVRLIWMCYYYSTDAPLSMTSVFLSRKETFAEVIDDVFDRLVKEGEIVLALADKCDTCKHETDNCVKVITDEGHLCKR